MKNELLFLLLLCSSLSPAQDVGLDIVHDEIRFTSDENGVELLESLITRDGISIYNSSSPIPAVSMLLDFNGRGQMSLSSPTLANGINLGYNSTGATTGTFRGMNNSINVGLGSAPWGSNLGYLAAFNAQGTPKAEMFVDLDGKGVVLVDDIQLRLRSSSRSAPQNFKVVVADKSTTFARGSAALESGEVFVPFPASFADIASLNDLTISLTPLSADTFGLAVIEKRSDGFLVKELKGGEGDFSFDWEAKASVIQR